MSLSGAISWRGSIYDRYVVTIYDRYVVNGARRYWTGARTQAGGNNRVI
jgi:hypothetical protein